jgi:hypothetical protein
MAAARSLASGRVVGLSGQRKDDLDLLAVISQLPGPPEAVPHVERLGPVLAGDVARQQLLEAGSPPGVLADEVEGSAPDAAPLVAVVDHQAPEAPPARFRTCPRGLPAK